MCFVYLTLNTRYGEPYFSNLLPPTTVPEMPIYKIISPASGRMASTHPVC
ncbi:hypothetical protein [Spirosoma panaciterrae]|nr:hypothetical protein [Spirosoma panaciterrae]